MRETTLSHILRCKIVAVVRGVKGERLIPMTHAFLLGGIDCIEITFDSTHAQSDSDTAAQISLLASQFGDKICIGAGTVMTRAQASLAASAGAQYIVSPGTIPDVIDMSRELGLVSIPGALTPTEILTAHRAGGDIVKLFPASFVGTEYLEQILPAVGSVPLMANGGVSVWNMRAFLDAGCAAVGIGGNLTGELYRHECDFGVLAETAKAYRAIADNERRPRNRDLR